MAMVYQVIHPQIDKPDMSNLSVVGQGNSLPNAVFGSALILQAEKWREAYRVALANAGIFLLLALAMFVLEPKPLMVILSAPALYFLGCMLSFLLMVRSGGDLAAIAWFVLGSGVYFGMGAVAGGLHVHPHSDYLFPDDTLYLVRVNLLNASSVFIALTAAYPLANMRGLTASHHDDMSLANIERILHRILPIIVAISAVGVGLKYVLFPMAESLLLRSMAAKIYLIIPSCFLLLGLLWHSTGWHLRLIIGGIFLLEILNGLISLTKYQVISAMLALAIGMWLTRRSVTFVLMTFMAVASVFIVINPLVTLGRAHNDYDAEKNTVSTRLAILADAVNAFYLYSWRQEGADRQEGTRIKPQRFKRDYSEKFTHDIKGMTATEARLRALGRRFDVATIQGYLINEYNMGRPGKSMVDIWTVMVPRVLWPQKPIVTRFGVELNAQYYYVPGQISSQTSSSAAPSYSGEAYWNYGIPGVVLVSILLGLGIGWFTRCWQFAMLGRDPAFFLISFPAAIWVSSVESWVVATYLGEFIIFVVILLLARASIAILRSLKVRVLM